MVLILVKFTGGSGFAGCTTQAI